MRDEAVFCDGLYALIADGGIRGNMISVIKEICIFVIIAQAILFFVPGTSYGKYVRLLVGMMLILRITEPLFGLILSEEKQLEIRERISELEQIIHRQEAELVLEDNGAVISREIEEELKKKLEESEGEYKIVSVSFDGKKENLTVTLSAEKEQAEEEGEIRIEPVTVRIGESRDEAREQELKERYGSILGVEQEKIGIVWR